MIFSTELVQQYPPHLRYVATLLWEFLNSNFLQMFLPARRPVPARSTVSLPSGARAGSFHRTQSIRYRPVSYRYCRRRQLPP